MQMQGNLKFGGLTMYNDENMLMTDLELVDEQEWEDAMRDAYEAMAAMDAPEIVISDNASEEQVRLVNDINWLLNGCNHKLETPITLRSRVCSGVYESVIYDKKQLYVERYDKAGDYKVQLLLETVISDDLDRLYGQLINEMF
jgi:hypothetical protein